jgi:hypothetical protein
LGNQRAATKKETDSKKDLFHRKDL